MPKQYADDAYFLSLYHQFLVLQRAQWRVVVLSAVPATEYSIEAAGESDPYAVTAEVGETLGSLRGKLKTAVNGASLLVTAASNLAAELLITEVKAGTVPGLAVEPDDGLSVEVVAWSDKYAALRAAWLGATKSFIDLCAWGEKAALGHATLAAHHLVDAITTDPFSGLSASAITSMREGPASVTFANHAETNSNPLASTGYGRKYLSLLDSLVLTPIADVGNFGCGTSGIVVW